MALSWTQASDVRDRWVGDDLTVPDTQIETLLEDAEDTVLREFPDMQDRVDRALGTNTTDGPAVPMRRLQKVLARMVIRHLRNPEGTRAQMDVAGPFTVNKTFGGDEPGALYLTDEDRAELGGHRRGGAFTIDTIPTATTPPDSPGGWLTIGRAW